MFEIWELGKEEKNGLMPTAHPYPDSGERFSHSMPVVEDPRILHMRSSNNTEIRGNSCESIFQDIGIVEYIQC